MDVVYILGSESAWNNNELRYSLRSVFKNLLNFNRIFIIGHKPEFIELSNESGCVGHQRLFGDIELMWMYHEDNMQLTKERRIMEKVKFACEQPNISDDFFFMNDDMFLLDKILTKDFPNYYKGTLLNSAKKRSNDRYKRALMNCHNALSNAGAVQLSNFDTHSPIVYNKEKFLEVMSRYDWSASAAKDGYVVKSLYANTLNLAGTFEPDCKIDEPMMPKRIWDKIVDRKFFSIGDNGLTDHMKQILEELYPDKAAWEI